MGDVRRRLDRLERAFAGPEPELHAGPANRLRLVETPIFLGCAHVYDCLITGLGQPLEVLSFGLPSGRHTLQRLAGVLQPRCDLLNVFHLWFLLCGWLSES